MFEFIPQIVRHSADVTCYDKLSDLGNVEVEYPATQNLQSCKRHITDQCSEIKRNDTK